MKPTEKQQEIIDYIKEGKNVVVSAIAGSGKTTTIIGLAEQCPNDRILCLTYSSMLKQEGRDKTSHLHNIEYTGYHAFVYKYSGLTTREDVELVANLDYVKGISGKWDIICLDEVQDTKYDYFKLVAKIIKANPQARLLVVGDTMQAIYEGIPSLPSDSRFLTMFDKIIDRPFEFVSMDESFRYGDRICKLVNRGKPYSEKQNTTVENLDLDDLGKKVKELLGSGYKKEDILCISNAPKNLTFEFANYERDFPIFISGVSRNDEEFRKNKIECISIHKSKGLERPVIIYIMTEKPKQQEESVSKILDYVAKTRAKTRLYIVKTEYLKKMDKERDREITPMEMEELSINKLCQYQYEPNFPNLKFERVETFGDVCNIKDKLSSKHYDGDKIYIDITPHVDYANRKAVFANEYPQKLRDFLISNNVPLNGVRELWEENSFVDEEIVRRLRELFKGSEQGRCVDMERRITFKGGRTFVGNIDIVDLVNKKVWKLIIANGDYMFDQKLEIAFYKAVMSRYQEYKDFEFLLVNPTNTYCLRVANSGEECLEILKEAHRQTTIGKPSDDEFLRRAKAIWENV